MSVEASASGYRDRNSTADRALTILEMFHESHLAISATEVAEELSVARSTAYRYLQSLVSRGFLEESPGGGFRLGLRVIGLSRLARKSYGLSDVALPIMRELCERFGYTVLLTRRAGATVTCLEREILPGQLIRLSYERGSLLPLTAGASALTLLAWTPEDEARKLLESVERPRFTEHTLTDVGELLKRLGRIREAGYGISRDEVDFGAIGIAAPIFDQRGEVVAALSIVALGGRVDEQTTAEMITALQEAGREVAKTLTLVEG
ncbi:IclR family transcriptional regulator [Arthrobacter sp. zg-ZUI100]|uniref:IclR family transcriptional regulator n=1 Tax=Arthrobacter jiangjiafuii TaxID=2817475 RepID=UPI001AEE7281|nr:IclR family transcriptional regulator [Arthrobacter jiangjiafuii]MBP3035219.1 IclR family transcriptional regulator [Arthrobacter jiangjiafuii]